MRWRRGDHLNFATPQGDQKNFTHTAGGSLKITELEKFPKASPLLVKNDTSLARRYPRNRSGKGQIRRQMSNGAKTVTERNRQTEGKLPCLSKKDIISKIKK